MSSFQQRQQLCNANIYFEFVKSTSSIKLATFQRTRIKDAYVALKENDRIHRLKRFSSITFFKYRTFPNPDLKTVSVTFVDKSTMTI